MAARPPAREAGPESIKPLSKQSCSVCTVVEACGPRSAGSQHTSSVKSEPSSQLCLHGFQQDGGPRDAGQPRASGRRAGGCTPGLLPCLHPLTQPDWKSVILMKQGCVERIRTWGCGKAASNVGSGLRERGRLDAWARDACQSSKQASVDAPAAIVI